MNNHEIVNITNDEAMDSKSEEVYTKGQFIVTKTLIPLGYNTAKIVFFVDSVEGHSYDSFANKEDAVNYTNDLVQRAV